MARIASTTSAGVQLPGGGQTLAALMARQKELAERQAVNQQQGATTIPGGLAQMSNALFTGLAQRKAAQQETEGRQALAQLVAGINPETGATPEQWGQAYTIDPALGATLMTGAQQARQTAREAELARSNRVEDRTWRVEDREDAQAAAAALKDPTETYRPPTQEEIEAYNLKPDSPVRVSNKTGKIEAIGGAPAVQLISPETAARLGLADEFLTNYETVLSSAKAGEMTGPIDYQKSVTLGRGPGGEAYRKLKQGTEGLVRLMTGAGMSSNEAIERSRQYEPQLTDDADTLTSKITGLKAAIESVRDAATFGRTAIPKPEADPEAPPPAATAEPPPEERTTVYTDDDVSETMKATGWTREQVLTEFNKRGYVRGGP